jgi:hypothetical protein
MAKLDTLSNIRSTWSIDDLMDAHEALDISEEAEIAAYERVNK